MADIRTFKQLRDEVLRFLDQAGETGTSKLVIDDTLRGVHTARLTERKWAFMLWDEPQTLTTVVGQRRYGLHQEFFRPLYFWNAATKNYVTQHVESNLQLSPYATATDYDRDGGAVTDWTTMVGTASRFKFAGLWPVQNQPTSASVLSVAGESGKTVVVKGVATSGIVSETITVGTPSTNSFSKILAVSKGDGWTQTLTLTSNSGAVTNLVLTSTEMSRQYRVMELLSTPTAAEAITYQFYRKPSALLLDNDIPDIPGEFSRVLVFDALLQVAAYNKTLDRAAIGLWVNEQKRLEDGLIEYDQGGDAVGAESSYFSYVPRD